MNKLVEWEDILVEKITRWILNKPTGNIYTDDLLSITELTIDNQLFEGDVQSLQDLVHYKNLRILKIEGNSFYDYKTCFTPLSTLSELEDLKIFGFPNVDFNFLSSLPLTLTRLWLWDLELSTIESICNLTNLKDLEIIVSKDCDLTPIKSLVHLESLSIDATDYSEEITTLLPFDLDLISEFYALRVLYFADIELVNVKPFYNKVNEFIIETEQLNLSDLIGLGNIGTLELRANVDGVNLLSINEIRKANIDSIKIFVPKGYHNYSYCFA